MITCRAFLLLLGLAALVGLKAATPATAPRTELEADLIDMTSTDTETRVVCTGNVVLTGNNLRIACDRLEVITSRIGDEEVTIGTIESFKYLLATGNVRIQQDQREVTCGRAEVLPLEEKVVLTEEPVLIDKSNDTVSAARTITLMRGQRQAILEGARISTRALPDLGANATDGKEAAPVPAPPAP